MERWVWQVPPPCDPGGKDPPSPGPHTALLSTLPRCNPLFVRCLKPNHTKVCDGGGPWRSQVLSPCCVTLGEWLCLSGPPICPAH